MSTHTHIYKHSIYHLFCTHPEWAAWGWCCVGALDFISSTSCSFMFSDKIQEASIMSVLLRVSVLCLSCVLPFHGAPGRGRMQWSFTATTWSTFSISQCWKWCLIPWNLLHVKRLVWAGHDNSIGSLSNESVWFTNGHGTNLGHGVWAGGFLSWCDVAVRGATSDALPAWTKQSQGTLRTTAGCRHNPSGLLTARDRMNVFIA